MTPPTDNPVELRPPARILLPAFRVLLLGLIAWLIHDQARIAQVRRSAEADEDRILQIARAYFPEAHQLEPQQEIRPSRFVLSEFGRRLGFVVRTSPESDHILGYSGPSDLLALFDNDGTLLEVLILASEDTPEYIQLVRRDTNFLSSFQQRSWKELQALRSVDGVSGATLTSLAMTEALLHRLRGPGPSLRFPDPIEAEEVRPFFPGAASLVPNQTRPNLLDVLDRSGNRLGLAGRTSPWSDNLVGYQGPTDILLVFSPGGTSLLGIRIRRSYETREYVEQVREDEAFMSRFNGMSLSDLAGPKFDVSSVEGVSGATMTSQAMADAIHQAAPHLYRFSTRRSPPSSFSHRDLGTVAVLGLAMGMAFTRLRGHRWVRVGFQVLLIGYLGFLNGDMLSQALLAGWAQNGIPWRVAPGLVLLTAAAMLVPMLTRRQLYCHHVCPHGAAQQLLKGILPRRHHLSQRWARWLRPVPFLLLGLVVASTMLQWPLNLAALEPFEAYLIQAAGWGTLTVAVIGLVASVFMPMAYCHYGCPTGAVLNFLWAGGRQERLNRRDAAAVLLLVLAMALRHWG